jgi:hypothetical protein
MTGTGAPAGARQQVAASDMSARSSHLLWVPGIRVLSWGERHDLGMKPARAAALQATTSTGSAAAQPNNPGAVNQAGAAAQAQRRAARHGTQHPPGAATSQATSTASRASPHRARSSTSYAQSAPHAHTHKVGAHSCAWPGLDVQGSGRPGGVTEAWAVAGRMQRRQQARQLPRRPQQQAGAEQSTHALAWSTRILVRRRTQGALQQRPPVTGGGGGRTPCPRPCRAAAWCSWR